MPDLLLGIGHLRLIGKGQLSVRLLPFLMATNSFLNHRS